MPASFTTRICAFGGRVICVVLISILACVWKGTIRSGGCCHILENRCGDISLCPSSRVSVALFDSPMYAPHVMHAMSLQRPHPVVGLLEELPHHRRLPLQHGAVTLPRPPVHYAVIQHNGAWTSPRRTQV